MKPGEEESPSRKSKLKESLQIKLPDISVLQEGENGGLDAIADCESPSYIDLKRKKQLRKEMVSSPMPSKKGSTMQSPT